MKTLGEYRAIHARILDDPRFADLSLQAFALWLVLRLRLGKSGIDVLFEGQMRGAGSPQALQELQDKGLLRIEGNVHWLVDALKYESTTKSYLEENRNHRKGIENHLRSLPERPLVNEFAERYGLEVPFPELQAPYHEPLREAQWSQQGDRGSVPHGSANTETETETDTVSRRETSKRHPRSGTSGDAGGVEKLRSEAEKLIVRHMLLGDDPAVSKDGRRLTLSDQLRTWDRLVADGWDPEELNGCIRHVRSILEEDLGGEPIGFGLLHEHPEIMEQARSAFHKSQPVPPLVAQFAAGVLERPRGEGGA